jgi:UDP-2-acetamido-3-amino-2,3-dideoxy-glucuronate N-acetyltransferase
VSTSTNFDKTAIVDEGASIGLGTKIWHFCHVCAGAVIGEDCVLGQNVYVSNDVKIGNTVKIQNNVSVYDGVILEDGVFCGPSVVFTNVYNPRSLFPRKNKYRKTIVKRGASLGANSTLVAGITVGEFAFIGAGAVVNRDVKPHAIMVGVPAKQIGWMSAAGARLALPLIGNSVAACPETGDKYQLNETGLVKVVN